MSYNIVLTQGVDATLSETGQPLPVRCNPVRCDHDADVAQDATNCTVILLTCVITLLLSGTRLATYCGSQDNNPVGNHFDSTDVAFQAESR